MNNWSTSDVFFLYASEFLFLRNWNLRPISFFKLSYKISRNVFSHLGNSSNQGKKIMRFNICFFLLISNLFWHNFFFVHWNHCFLVIPFTYNHFKQDSASHSWTPLNTFGNKIKKCYTAKINHRARLRPIPKCVRFHEIVFLLHDGMSFFELPSSYFSLGGRRSVVHWTFL